jgi:hypothetical protein
VYLPSSDLSGMINYLSAKEVINIFLPLLQDSFRGLQECIPNLRGDKTSRAQVCYVDDEVLVYNSNTGKQGGCTPHLKVGVHSTASYTQLIKLR